MAQERRFRQRDPAVRRMPAHRFPSAVKAAASWHLRPVHGRSEWSALAPPPARPYCPAMDSGIPPAPAATFPAYTIIEGDPAAGLILLCDHADNRLPPEYGDLGLPAPEFRRHIAYDPGAADVTRALAATLGVPAVLSTFSRLLIDPNRGEDDPTLVMRLSDGAVIPGNARVDAAERQERIRRFHAPYHAAIEATVDRALAVGSIPALFSVHSFTPVWRGIPRPWHAGVLWDLDPRLAVPFIDALRADASLVVGDNEPYAGALRNDTMYRHATQRGLAHALIEIRQDLIADESGVADWTARLATILATLNRDPAIHEARQYGSKADAG
jgi:predicted N-formylglutamate amidohydrolase